MRRSLPYGRADRGRMIRTLRDQGRFCAGGLLGSLGDTGPATPNQDTTFSPNQLSRLIISRRLDNPQCLLKTGRTPTPMLKAESCLPIALAKSNRRSNQAMREIHAAFVIIGFAIFGLVTSGLLVGDYAEKEAFGEDTGGAFPSSSATVYRASLTPIGNTDVTGEVTVRVEKDELLVSVNATGLEADVEHAQHVHENESCNSPGNPLVSLDDNIPSSPGDAANADPGDDSFPTATPGGTVNYRQKAAKSAIEKALGTGLDLADRTVVVHAAGNPIGEAIACGALDPVSN